MNKQRYLEIDGQQIAVTEEVYLTYKRPLWAEQKRRERAERCRDENGSRCMKSCRECPKFRDVGDISLDRLFEDGFEIADSVDITEVVADRLLKSQLAAALESLEPEERSLIDAIFYDDRTEQDYAAEMGISQKAVSKRKNKVIEKLRQALGEITK